MVLVRVHQLRESTSAPPQVERSGEQKITAGTQHRSTSDSAMGNRNMFQHLERQQGVDRVAGKVRPVKVSLRSPALFTARMDRFSRNSLPITFGRRCCSHETALWFAP